MVHFSFKKLPLDLLHRVIFRFLRAYFIFNFTKKPFIFLNTFSFFLFFNFSYKISCFFLIFQHQLYFFFIYRTPFVPTGARHQSHSNDAKSAQSCPLFRPRPGRWPRGIPPQRWWIVRSSHCAEPFPGGAEPVAPGPCHEPRFDRGWSRNRRYWPLLRPWSSAFVSFVHRWRSGHEPSASAYRIQGEFRRLRGRGAGEWSCPRCHGRSDQYIRRGRMQRPKDGNCGRGSRKNAGGLNGQERYW